MALPASENPSRQPWRAQVPSQRSASWPLADENLALQRRVRGWLYGAFLALALAVSLLGAGLLGLVLLLLSIAITEPIVRAMAQQARRQSSFHAELQRRAGVAEHTSAMVLISNAEDRIEWVNAAFTQQSGWRLDDVAGRQAAECLHSPAQERDDAMRLRQALQRGTGLRQAGPHRTRVGRDLWLDVDLRPLRDSDGVLTGFVRVCFDASEHHTLRLAAGAPPGTDMLTQLPNRQVVLARLQQVMAHASRHPGYGFAVLFMDMDRFKHVNDSLGHSAGDELLRQVAQRLQLTLRPSDALARLGSGAEALAENGDDVEDGGAAQGTGRQVPPGHEVAARLGGDEFVVVLEGVNSSDRVSAIADRVLRELSEPYLIGCTPLHTSASIGVVLHLGVAAGTASEDVALPASAEDVMRNADTAMYEAKRGGRGRWVMFDNSMQERVARAMAIENDLRRALKADELFVVYQPVVDLQSRALTGVEALVRWRHPERGLVNPVDFIGVAEECGLIDAVGAFVLQRACTQFVRWRERLGGSAPLRLAVNVSRAQLKRAGVVDELAALLQACAMRPEWLQLEVTESLAAQDEPVQATLRKIKALGVQLALDDFGTGYSSLACLHQLPVDTVKVDRSFVQHAQTVEYHRVLIEATIRVAGALGMTTVAEGIETEAQAALMLALNCNRGQGYLFGRPMEAAALEVWLRAEALQSA